MCTFFAAIQGIVYYDLKVERSTHSIGEDFLWFLASVKGKIEKNFVAFNFSFFLLFCFNR